MIARIYPGKASGTAAAPPSKSMAHRLLIAAALSDGESTVQNLALSEDILATADCLRILGRKLAIENGTGVLKTGEAIQEAHVRESGSTLRFLIPLALIILKSVAGVIPSMAGAMPVLNFFGEPFVALLIATIVAMFLLGTKNGYTLEELEKVMTRSLEPTGLILLVTACGGVLRYMLQYSGIGDIIGNVTGSLHLPVVVLAFIIAVLVRICVGSATVAMTMAAGIVAAMPAIQGLSPLYLACTTAAVAGGATVCSHFNDSGFWLVKSLIGLDEKTTLKTWTIMETLVGGVGFLVALVISMFA